MSEVQAPSRDLDGLKDLVAQALEEARRLGAASAEASVSADTGLSTTVRLGEVETLEYHKDQGLGITVYIDGCKGSASTSDLSAASLREAAEAAARIARYTAEDPCAGLADAALMAKDYPELDLDHPWDIGAEKAIALAKTCEDAARGQDTRIVNSEGASLNSFRGTAVYGNTHGFIGGYSATRHTLSCSVVGEDEGGMQRDYWYSVARDAGALQAPEEVGHEAARRTLHRLGARKLSTRQAPVIFAADIARSLIGHFIGAIRGGALYRKASFLLDHLERPVFPDFVHIEEQPHLPGALGSAPFDNEGVGTHARNLVEAGVLKGYVLDSYSACKLGLRTTGNAGGTRNLTIRPGEYDLAGLIKHMGEGLLVTELIGHGINMVTGDYSRGAAGFWVEGGEIAYPVEEITVAGNLKDMFMGLEQVGTDVDLRGNIRTGSLLLRGLTIAGD